MGGLVGFITNILLFVLKIIIGIITSSISITTDAINNLSDSSSSLITIVSFKMSSKPADDDHPYGHARFEYISSLLVGCLIFVVGIQFFINSLKKTINPATTEFNMVIAILLFVSILVKVWQSLFYNKIAKTINSNVMAASSIDSRNDVIITSVVLISAIIQYFTGLLLDGPIGILVSLLVMYSAVDLLKETFDLLIGAAPKRKLLEGIEEKIKDYPSVIGVHDLIVHSYGNDSTFATAHVEIPATQDIMVSHEIIDKIERDFLRNENIDLVIHLDPVVTDDPILDSLENLVKKITKEIDECLSMHDFRLINGSDYKRLVFDITVPDHCKMSDEELRSKYNVLIKQEDPSLEAVIIFDRNYISSVY